MGITQDQILISAALFTAAIVVFARARLDYERYGHLTHLSSLLVILIFLLLCFTSNIFLHSNIGTINIGSITFIIALGLMALGLAGMVMALFQLGWNASIGRRVLGLQQSGLYRITRNPQLVGLFLLLTGYALVWPSWSGALWVALYLSITTIMVRIEEEHLGRIYGEEYRIYCERTPRYIGIPKKIKYTPQNQT